MSRLAIISLRRAKRPSASGGWISRVRVWALFWALAGPSIGGWLACAEEPQATSVANADRVCAGCHEPIYRAYLKTPMANASGAATEYLIPASFRHVASGVEYKVSKEDDAAWLSYQAPGAFGAAGAETSGKHRLDYFLGSGHLGVTYLYSQNGYLIESPVAYYPDLKGYDMKPGLEAITHLPGALTINAACLRCHMSGVQRQDLGTEDRYQGLPFLHTGITCESCHGDAARHVATRGKAAVVNPIKLDPARRDATCIVCHLEGTTSVERRGRSLLDFKPGDEIRDFVSYFAYASEDTTVRAVSEVEQLTQSRCKQASGPAMSCMSCHDPHLSPSPVERTAFYRSKCLACHAAPRFASTHHSENPDCTSCHMPRAGARNILHVAWTDHRILARRENQPEPAASSGGGLDRRLLLVLPEDENLPDSPLERFSDARKKDTARNLGLAYYNLAVNGNAAQKDHALSLLKSVASPSTNDAAVLRALGVLSEWNGDHEAAEQYYRALLKQEPESLAASVNLGTLLARSGNLQAAEALWQPAFERNEDVLGLGENLAKLDCMMGERDRAIGVLKRILVYSPGLPAVVERLKAIESGALACPAPSPRPAAKP